MYTISPFERAQIDGLRPSLLLNKIKIPSTNLRLLFAKIEIIPSGCWKWTGATSNDYGVIKIRSIRSTAFPVHRLCYELVNGAVDPILDVHHMVPPEGPCLLGRTCCNPDHVRPVGRAEHIRDLTPGSASYVAAHRTHCAAGHEYNSVTMRFTRELRQCRICDAIKAKALRAANRGHDRPPHKKDPAKFKTHCKRGHDLSVTAKIIETKWGPQRQCRECMKEVNAACKARKKALVDNSHNVKT